MFFEKIENNLRKPSGSFFDGTGDNKAGCHLDFKTLLNTSHIVIICSNIIILSQETARPILNALWTNIGS